MVIMIHGFKKWKQSKEVSPLSTKPYNNKRNLASIVFLLVTCPFYGSDANISGILHPHATNTAETGQMMPLQQYTHILTPHGKKGTIYYTNTPQNQHERLLNKPCRIELQLSTSEDVPT